MDKTTLTTIFSAKTFSAFAAAALLAAGVLAFAPGLTAPVEAGTPSAKGDRLDWRLLGTKCSQRAWPYFEEGCMRDGNTRRIEVKAARLVTTDRF